MSTNDYMLTATSSVDDGRETFYMFSLAFHFILNDALQGKPRMHFEDRDLQWAPWRGTKIYSFSDVLWKEYIIIIDLICRSSLHVKIQLNRAYSSRRRRKRRDGGKARKSVWTASGWGKDLIVLERVEAGRVKVLTCQSFYGMTTADDITESWMKKQWKWTWC